MFDSIEFTFTRTDGSIGEVVMTDDAMVTEIEADEWIVTTGNPEISTVTEDTKATALQLISA